MNTIKECKWHCLPSVHPGQVDENKLHYGCLHEAWPQNRKKDFCPIVKCNGNFIKCEIPKRFIRSMLLGKKRKITNAYKKIEMLKNEIKELEEIFEKLN